MYSEKIIIGLDTYSRLLFIYVYFEPILDLCWSVDLNVLK